MCQGLELEVHVSCGTLVGRRGGGEGRSTKVPWLGYLLLLKSSSIMEREGALGYRRKVGKSPEQSARKAQGAVLTWAVRPGKKL